MELTTSVEQGVAVIGCEGRLTMTTAARLRDALAEVVPGRATRVVVDLKGTTFIDSSGLGALVSGLKSARLAGGDLRIAGAGEQVLTVLSLTNLDRILKPHPTVLDARDGW
jgi:anti-sigma B factor antagonist